MNGDAITLVMFLALVAALMFVERISRP